MSDLPADIARCCGKTAIAMGEPVLCAICTDCRRFTSSRVGESVSFIEPPKFAQSWTGHASCPMYFGRYDYELEVV